ncbi:hypothetical protein AYI70_g7212, partial [Smittium culicis]
MYLSLNRRSSPGSSSILLIPISHKILAIDFLLQPLISGKCFVVVDMVTTVDENTGGFVVLVLDVNGGIEVDGSMVSELDVLVGIYDDDLEFGLSVGEDGLDGVAESLADLVAEKNSSASDINQSVFPLQAPKLTDTVNSDKAEDFVDFVFAAIFRNIDRPGFCLRSLDRRGGSGLNYAGIERCT